MSSAAAWGEPAELLTPAEVQKLVPYLDDSVILGGFHSPTVGAVDSLRAGTIMRERARLKAHGNEPAVMAYGRRQYWRQHLRRHRDGFLLARLGHRQGAIVLWHHSAIEQLVLAGRPRHAPGARGVIKVRVGVDDSKAVITSRGLTGRSLES